MKVVKIVVTKAQKVNLGNYQTADRSITFEVEPTGNEKPLDVYKKTSDFVFQTLQSELAQRYR